jgi:prepilin-type N-terminal cleavage/methylation domain-containing protein
MKIANWQKRAFTLIELLVVISIIVLLVSILLPSLQMARELGRRVACASNLRNIGMSLVLWAQDNEELYPQQGDMPWRQNYFFTSFNPSASDQEPPYPSYFSGDYRIFHCPSHAGELDRATVEDLYYLEYSFYQRISQDSDDWTSNDWKGFDENLREDCPRGLMSPSSWILGGDTLSHYKGSECQGSNRLYNDISVQWTPYDELIPYFRYVNALK